MTKRAKSIHDWAITIFALSMVPGIFISSYLYEVLVLGGS